MDHCIFTVCTTPSANIKYFAAVIRMLTYSLYDCIRNSSNSLLIAYVESDLYYRSKLHKWRRLLYTCMDKSCIVVVFIV